MNSYIRELSPDTDWDAVVESGMEDFMRFLDVPGGAEVWRNLIHEVVETVWVELDGGLTIEGVLTDETVPANPGTAVNGTSEVVSAFHPS